MNKTKTEKIEIVDHNLEIFAFCIFESFGFGTGLSGQLFLLVGCHFLSFLSRVLFMTMNNLQLMVGLFTNC